MTPEPTRAAPWAPLAAEYDNLLACVRCGLCLTACPTYVLTAHEAESPRGRLALARALAEGRLALTPDLVQHEQSCLVCEACSAVCPCGVRMGPVQSALRAGLGPAGAARRLLPLFADLRRLRVAVAVLGLYQRAGLQALARRSGLLRALGLAGLDALLPPLPRSFLIPRDDRYPPATSSDHGLCQPPSPLEPETVALFAGCVMSTVLADVDRATVRVLQRAGCAVVAPAGQGCCGALHAHAGDRSTARALARRNVAAFARHDTLPIVVNAAGCGAFLKEYGHLLGDDPAWAARAGTFAARVRDVTEFLAPRLGTAPARAGPPGPRRVVTYQDACHLAHAQGLTEPPRALLRAVPGLVLREMAEPGLCCGSAGLYNLTHPHEATALRERKLAHALATGAEVIATANPGCLLHLQAGLRARGSPVRVEHVVTLLDEMAVSRAAASTTVDACAATPSGRPAR